MAVRAEDLAALEAGEALGEGLAAAGAFYAAEYPRALGQGDERGLYVKKLGGLAALEIGEALGPAHALRAGAQDEAHAFAGAALIKAEGLLAGEMEHQVALAGAAAEHYLHGVHAAGVVFAYAADLLVAGELEAEKLDGVKRGLVAYGEAAALVAVEGGAVGP